MEITIDEHGVVRQDGLTPDEWLDDLFEYEYCAECLWDKDKHTVVMSPLGHFFALCNDPISIQLEDDAFDAECKRREHQR